MRIFRLFLCLLSVSLSLSGSLLAAQPDGLAAANQSLSSGHSAEALSAYQTLLTSPELSNFSSPEIWYNRGLAEEKNGDSVLASLSYRRALLLDPTFLPARARLSTALTTLGISENKDWHDRLLLTIHPDRLILGGAILGWLGVLVLVFLLIAGPRRPAWIALVLLALILGHGLSLVGTWSDPRRLASDEAVITARSAPTLRDTPADSSKANGTLTPGSLVTILSRNGAWWKVSDGAATTGWIPSITVTPLLHASGS